MDLLDESVGAFVLPVTATLIAIVFVRFQDEDALDSQIGTGLPWQYTGQGVEVVGPLPRLAVLVGSGVVLYLVGRVLATRLPSSIRRRRL